jgi:hypothetical protein
VSNGRGKRGPNTGPKAGAMTALALTTDFVTERISAKLRVIYGGDTKRLARDAGANRETVKNWLEGRNTMTLTNFLRLCQNNPDLFAEARRLVQMDAELDPNAEAALMRFVMDIVRHRQDRIGKRSPQNGEDR